MNAFQLGGIFLFTIFCVYFFIFMELKKHDHG